VRKNTLRWYHEFGAENRLEGDSIFLTNSLPLHIHATRAEAQDWSKDAEE